MKSRLLQGYVLSGSADLTRENVLLSQSLSFVGQITGTKWDEYRFRSSRPMRGEMQYNIGGVWEYIVISRRSGPRLLLLSEATAIVEVILESEAMYARGLPLRRVGVAVDALVKEIAHNPGEFLLSRVDARVAGYGTALRSITLYGEDIGEARMFREQLTQLQCYACGIRHAQGGAEICRLVNRGGISFRYSGNRSLKAVEQAIGFVSKNQYLEVTNA
jgi:hypothetical protein